MRKLDRLGRKRSQILMLRSSQSVLNEPTDALLGLVNGRRRLALS